jgi:hypothetical protein
MKRKWLQNKEKGQSLVEVALVLPIILLLLVGMVEVGWAIHSYVTVGTATREATRFGARANFDAEEVAEAALVALGSLDVQLEGPDVNTTVMATFVDIAPTGTYTITTPYITGTLPVTSSIFSGEFDIDQIAQDNVAFNQDPFHCPIGVDPPCGTRNDIIVVEIFYRHHQMLDLPMVSDILSNPIEFYSRGVMRLGNSRSD